MNPSYQPPSGWRFPAIEELAAPEKGAIRIGPFGSALKKDEYSESGVRVLGIEDVFPNKLISERRKYIPELKFRELSQYVVRAGDLLVTNMGTVGRTCVVPSGLETSIISSHLIKISLDSQAAWPSYISWMLNFCPLVVAQIRAKCHGAIMAGFNSGLLKELRIPLPPLLEQRWIAEVLDRAEALRAKRRAARGQLDTLTQAIFLDLFGDPATNPKRWRRVRIQDAVVGKFGIKAGPFGSSLKKEDYVTTAGYRVYGQEQVIAGRFDIGDYYIGERKYQQLKACAVKEGDLLISLVGSFGRVLVVPRGIEPGIINPRLLKITPNHDLVTSDFLAAAIALPTTQVEFERMAHGGTMGILNAGLLKRLQVLAPPLPLQHDFARRAAAVEKLRAAHSASLAELDALFATLQHRAFRGEL